MANRHLSRSIVLQTLFEWDYRGYSEDAAREALERNAEEFAPGMGDVSFMKSLMDSIFQKRNDLDMVIEKAAPEWPIDRISVIDRNILRIGLFELLFADRDQVPAKVAINEAIELAKTFGGDNSGKFVNGVLGSVYKELGEPGKDTLSAKKRSETLPFEKLPIERLGGAVVYARGDDGNYYFALVHDVFGHWTLSKGKIEEGEEVDEGTKREVKEELGLEVEIKEQLGENEYVASNPQTGKKRKQVTYFLAEAPFEELQLEQKGGLDGAQWFKVADIADLNFYSDILPIVTKAVTFLQSNALQESATHTAKPKAKKTKRSRTAQ